MHTTRLPESSHRSCRSFEKAPLGLNPYHLLDAALRTLLAAALLFVFVPAQPARAASIVVNTLADEQANVGSCSLREAMMAAMFDAGWIGCAAGSGDDTITFSVSGIINLTLGSLPTITYPGTAQALTIDGGNNITVDGNDPGLTILYVYTSTTTTLQNITFTDGDIGVYIDGGALNLSGATFSYFDNHAIYDDAAGATTVTGSTFHHNADSIWNLSGALSVSSSDFNSNSGGGGIYNSTGNTLNVANTTFSDNSDDMMGVGIMNNGTATVDGCTFTGNAVNNPGSSVGGGAIYNYAGNMSISNSVFDGNSVSSQWAHGGGGLPRDPWRQYDDH